MKELTATWLSKQSLSKLLFLLLVVLLPVQTGYHFWPDWALVSGLRVDYFAPTIYATDLIVLLLFLSESRNLLKSISKLVKSKRKYLIAALAIFILFNLAFSLNVSVSVYKLLRILEMVFLVWWVKANKEFVLDSLTPFLTIALAYTLAISLAQVFLERTTGLLYILGERSFNIATPGIALTTIFGRTILRPYATFPHPNALAGFSLISFFLILTTGKQKVLRVVGLTLGFAGVILSFSSGALLAFVVGFGIYLLSSTYHVAKIYRQIVLAFIFSSLLLMPLSQKLLTMGFKFPETIANRLQLASVAGNALSVSPIFGLGLGNFISYIPKAQILNRIWLLQPVHNLVDLVVTEGGFFGLILFGVLLLSVRVKENPKTLLLILPIFITGFFDHYWLTLQQTSFLFAMVVGILF